MTVGKICVREVDTAAPDEIVQAAAQRMATRNVGTLVVLDRDKRVLGIVTDRDLAIRVVGQGKDPNTIHVKDVMTDQVHTVFEDMPIEDVLAMMRSQSVRRIPVVRSDGALVGLVCLDDVLALIAEEIEVVGQVLKRTSPRSLAKA